MNAEALIGTVLGTSTLQQLIGQGGMGAVYLAQQSRPRRQVAVKVLMPATSLKPHQLSAFLERFRRETDAAASLEHPNIMPVYEYGERGGLAYLVMPYISAGTLRDVMEQDGLMAFTVAVKYLEQMAAALDFAHARGVIHRDIKPANMLLTPDGRLLLTDFGLVKVLSDHQSDQIRLTGAGAPVGTPDYMSPEQVIGGEVDGRADQYSLGVVLFQMLTGTTPFQGETPMQIASQQLHMQPPAPRLLRPDLSEAAEQVLLRAMAKRPDERFNSAQEFASAFRAALVAQPYASNMGHALYAGGPLTGSDTRKRSLFDPRWQGTGTMAAFGASQINPAASSGAAPSTSFAAHADAMPPMPRPAGTGLLSKTGLFPRVGLNENTGALSAPLDPFSTGHQMAASTGTQQSFFAPAASQGFQTDTFQQSGLQSSFFAQSDGVAQQPFPAGSLQQLSPALQQPFPTGNLRQLSPSMQSTTSALSLLNAEQKTGGNTIKLTGPVKVVQVPVAPGQYVTGLLPVQKEMANPVSEPPLSRRSKKQKIALALTACVFLVGILGGGLLFMRAHSGASPTTRSNVSSVPPGANSTASAQATAAATSNVVLSDPLNQNIHSLPVDNEHAFTNGAYHIVNQSSTSSVVIIPQDFAQKTLGYQVTMEEIQGNDASATNTFGMILRYSSTASNGQANHITFYTFEILNENGNSQYSFYKYDSAQTAKPWGDKALWTAKAGPEFHGGQGSKAMNTIKVFADGTAFTFYVNGQKVGTQNDSSLASGSVGMLVNLKGTEIAFSNMLITTN